MCKLHNGGYIWDYELDEPNKLQNVKGLVHWLE